MGVDVKSAETARVRAKGAQGFHFMQPFSVLLRLSGGGSSAGWKWILGMTSELIGLSNVSSMD